jgi:sterol desaturase/sphingolipid hydroxylase (fatty acid hydroxylase superfamily)
MPAMNTMEFWRLVIFWGALSLFLILELLIPYRPYSVSKFKRWTTNLALTLFNSLVLQFLFTASILGMAAYVTQNKVGILYLLQWPYWARVLATIVFMDFMLYIWHLLNHEVPFFWRFHRVHHSDLNMDVSTATRFHLGELALSAVIRIGLIYLLGAELLGIFLYDTLVVLAAQFHHSSLNVPIRFERLFWTFFVPPSMHRIHHSVVIKERNANYGTIFSLWDRFLGTLLRDSNQEKIRIGMGAYSKIEKLKFLSLLVMPFTRSVR